MKFLTSGLKQFLANKQKHVNDAIKKRRAANKRKNANRRASK